jgi:hypothetical protein
MAGKFITTVIVSVFSGLRIGVFGRNKVKLYEANGSEIWYHNTNLFIIDVFEYAEYGTNIINTEPKAKYSLLPLDLEVYDTYGNLKYSIKGWNYKSMFK